MAYSRCVCVLSLPRSGSSTVAGMLHRLGVDMGTGHFQGHDDNNPRGYYEDLRFQELAKSLSGERYGTRKPAVIPEQTQRKYSALIAERAALPCGVSRARVPCSFCGTSCRFLNRRE